MKFISFLCAHILLTGVGKSNLLLRFSDDSFTTSFITTIGYVSIRIQFLVFLPSSSFILFSMRSKRDSICFDGSSASHGDCSSCSEILDWCIAVFVSIVIMVLDFDSCGCWPVLLLV